VGNSNFDRLRRRVRLDGRNGWLGGVCAGLANYFSTDPAFIRVGTVVAALFATKIVIALYLVAWLLLDEEERVR
jgi:phage shock protein C